MKVSKKKGLKVFVGMSGGVDSSVSAALLKELGYDVTGVFIKVWQPDFLNCDWRAERLDAMRVAAQLDIPFLTFDFEKEYKKYVVDYMIAEYKSGRTPNPDVMCNKEIKFGAFLKKALSMGADYVATGHYAQNKNGLYESADKEKDQSYFLWTLTSGQLKHVLFPVGGMTKPEVRKLAKKFDLPTAEKKDSQGLCFIGHVDMKDFLEHYLAKDKAAQKGSVLSESAEKIGTHKGSIFYTIGQRHGFTIFKKTADDAALYVTAKDIKKNTITVSARSSQIKSKNKKVTSKAGILLENISWTGEAPNDLKKTYSARIRYRQPLEACTLSKIGQGAKSTYSIHFKKTPEAVSSGQSLVIYDGTHCLGGGVIV